MSGAPVRPSIPCWLLSYAFVAFWWLLAGLVFAQLVGLTPEERVCVVAAHGLSPAVYLLVRPWTADAQAVAFHRTWAAGQGLGLLYLLCAAIF